MSYRQLISLKICFKSMSSMFLGTKHNLELYTRIPENYTLFLPLRILVNQEFAILTPGNSCSGFRYHNLELSLATYLENISILHLEFFFHLRNKYVFIYKEIFYKENSQNWLSYISR